jgi:hypothetical protein
LALPSIATKVEVNSMVKAVQDLYAVTHSMNSLIAMHRVCILSLICLMASPLRWNFIVWLVELGRE